MNNYTFSLSNPEYVEKEFNFLHEQQFSREEFLDICESVYLEALTEIQEHGDNYISDVTDSQIINLFESRGFIVEEKRNVVSWDINPFYGDQIKSVELRKKINEILYG